MGHITREVIDELLRLKNDESLYHRENKELEFKVQFNLAGLAEYFRDFAAFANNVGGYIIFGVSNSPRRLIGLSKKSREQFDKIDPERISGYLLDIFSPDILWEQQIIDVSDKSFGVFYVHGSVLKPVIAKKDEGRDNLIKNGDIYYRYAGRTQKIEFSELNYIIEQRIKGTNDQWISLMSKIAKAGPANAAILDTERGLIEKDKHQMLVLDKELAKKLNFVKEGHFSESSGALALKLVGDVLPIGFVEATKIVKEKLLDSYPYSAKELVAEVKKELPDAKEHLVYRIIRDNNLKNDTNYAEYNYPRKSKEEEYRQSGEIPKNIPSIYNNNAVTFIVKILKEQGS